MTAMTRNLSIKLRHYGFLLSLVLVQHCSAQTPDVSPDISISVGGVARSQLCVGEQATFSAENQCTADPDGPINYSWSGAVSGTNQTVYGSFTTTGNRTATVNVHYNTAEGGVYDGSTNSQFTVKTVSSITYAKSAVCLGQQEPFQVATDPANCYEGITITVPDGELISYSTSTGIAQVKLNVLSTDNNDKKTVTAKCGDPSCSTCTGQASTQVVVAKVASITRSPSDGPTTVCKDEFQQFQVETEPTGHYDKPIVVSAFASVNYDTNSGIATVHFTNASQTAVNIWASCGPDSKNIETTVVDVGPIYATCTNRVGADGGQIGFMVTPTPSNRQIEWRYEGSSQVWTGTTFTVTAPSGNGFFTVTASDKDLPTCSETFEVEVVGHCGANYPWENFAYDSTEEGRPANCGGDLALFEPPPFAVAITGNYTACHGVISNTTAWFPRIVALGFTYYKDVCCGSRTAITNATMVTSNDFCNGILAELEPPGAYTNYCAPTCLEDYVSVGNDAYWAICTNQWAVGEAIVESKTKSFVCIQRDAVDEAERDLEDDVNSALQSVYNNIIAQWNSQFATIEEAAYDAEEACLQALSSEIEQKAYINGWTCP